MFSVSWIRHLARARGEMLVAGGSHTLPATAELPSASRPGDRTDRFRPTCHTLRRFLFGRSRFFFKNVLSPECT